MEDNPVTMSYMKKIGFLMAIVLSACGSGQPKNEELAGPITDTIEQTKFDDKTSKIKPMSIDSVRIIDSLLFEKSRFKDLNCCRDFYFDRKGPDCCCEDLLNSYKEKIQGWSPNKIATLNASDPSIKKCRLKLKGWGKRFDQIINKKRPDDIKKDPGI